MICCRSKYIHIIVYQLQLNVDKINRWTTMVLDSSNQNPSKCCSVHLRKCTMIQSLNWKELKYSLLMNINSLELYLIENYLLYLTWNTWNQNAAKCYNSYEWWPLQNRDPTGKLFWNCIRHRSIHNWTMLALYTDQLGDLTSKS